uniref:mitotic apparatus protein p62-like isoform X2 n=1 Tax=Scatophagus argus TaxID=75038 RepID=UPI001ED82503|nr:mitotic apparatus protein p62-like isoform X2 [Scatophagus argus]
MQMQMTCIVFICLCGTVSSGRSLNTLQEMDALLETSSEAPELDTAGIRPSGNDTGLTLLDTHISTASVPAECEDECLHEEAEEKREHQGADFRKQEASRRRRGAWGKRKHAATVEANAYRIAGLGRPLMGWGKRGKGEETSALMTVLKELHAEKHRLMDQRKAQEEEEEEDDDEDEDEDEDEDDDDDDDDEEEEEEEVKMLNVLYK